DDEYTHWNCPDTEWVTTLSDLVNPKKIIQKKDDFDEDWLRLRYYKKWEEPKKIGKDKYFGRRKDVFYLIESYLVRKTDKLNIIKYLENRNLWGRQMPERRDEHSLLFNREKFWSPAYLDTYQSNKRIWYTIPDTSYKVLVTTEAANGGIENDKSGACGSYRIPCKYIFEKMQLQYAPVDGLLKNMEGEIIVFNHNLRGVLIKKKGLIQFLNENKLEIIWTVLGEKLSFIDDRNEESYFKVPCGVFWLNEHGKMEGELKMYDRY
ncbi:MAG: hypothetical protein LBQ60_08750, partial [Bacteroidales bacterium]|nr:hypothetical protein [Bacteroidales bacterium]